MRLSSEVLIGNIPLLSSQYAASSTNIDMLIRPLLSIYDPIVATVGTSPGGAGEPPQLLLRRTARSTSMGMTAAVVRLIDTDAARQPVVDHAVA
jgi:hypothetical protein